MKVDANCSARLYQKGSWFYESGCNYTWTPGCAPEWTGYKDEQMSWKTDCYIGDWTLCVDDSWYEGPDCIKFFKRFMTNSFENWKVGTGKHYIMCNDAGKVRAEGIIIRLEEEKFVIESFSQVPFYLYETHKDEFPNMTVRMPEWKPYQMYGGGIGAELFKFQVSGPKALGLCEKVTRMDLRSVKFMNIIPVTVNGVKCMALRQGMAGEIGFEFQGPIDKAAEVFNYIFKAGEEFSCRRLGARTGMINHLEACFPTYAIHYVDPIEEDYDNYQIEAGFTPFRPAVSGSYDGEWEGLTRSPYEMGWTSGVKFDHDFVGREALEKEVNHVKKNVVTLELNNEDMVELYASQFWTDKEPYEINDLPMNPNCCVQADKIFSEDGKEIGVSTTPGYSYYFRKMLALSFVDVEYCKPGTQVKVLWGTPGKPQKMIRATVAPAPYKKDNRRVDLSKV